MPTTTPGAVTYRPALLPGGGVSLGRAVRFAALVQEVMQDKVDRDLARLNAVVDERLEAGPAPEPKTFAEFTGAAPVAPEAAQLPPATGFEIYEAVVNGGYAGRFAACCVEAVLPNGAVRDVTPDEADGPAFPSKPLADALSDFSEAAEPLMSGLLRTQSATGSISTPGEEAAT